MSSNGPFPIIEDLVEPIVIDKIAYKYYSDGVLGDTVESVRKALEARRAIPDFNSNYHFIGEMLAQEGRTGKCLVTATQGQEDILRKAAGIYRHDKTIAGKVIQLRNGHIIASGPVINVFTGQRDLRHLAANLVHEGRHHLNFSVGLHPSTLLDHSTTHQFYTAYIQDSAPLAKTGVGALPLESPAGTLFKAPREIYFNEAVQRALREANIPPAQLDAILKKAEMAFYQGAPEVGVLTEELSRLAISKPTAEAAFAEGHRIRSAEKPALIATAEMHQPGVASQLLPHTYKVEVKMLDAMRHMRNNPQSIMGNPQKFFYFDLHSNTLLRLDARILPQAIPRLRAGKLLKRGLHIGGKVLHYGALPAGIAIEYYGHNKPLPKAIIDGSSDWAIGAAIGFSAHAALKPLIGGGPATGLLIAADFADMGPDMLALHQEQIEHFPETTGMSMSEARQAIDEFYMMHPFAKPETIIQGHVQRMLAALSTRSLYENIFKPMCTEPSSLARISLPPFFDDGPLTPEHRQLLEAFSGRYQKTERLTPKSAQQLEAFRELIQLRLGVEEHHVEAHLCAKRRAELLEQQRQAAESTQAPMIGPPPPPSNEFRLDTSSDSVADLDGLLAQQTLGSSAVEPVPYGQRVYHCTMDSPLLTNQFSPEELQALYTWLSTLNEHDGVQKDDRASEKPSPSDEPTVQQAETSERLRPTPIKKTNVKDEPFIKEVGIGRVGSGVGLVVTLAKGGVIGFAPGVSGGFTVTLTAEFTKDFLMALGTGALIGGAVVGVALLAQHFYNQHQRHILEGVQKAYSYTRKDLSFVERKISSLYQSMPDFTSSKAIHEIEGLVGHDQVKIQTFLDRGQKALTHKKPKAANAQFSAARELYAQNRALKETKSQIQLDALSDVFVREHQADTPEALLSHARQITEKPHLDREDIATLHGINKLLRHNVINLTTNGKKTEAQALLQQADELQFFIPGGIESFGFTPGTENLHKDNQNDAQTLNHEIKHANRIISAGGDPLPVIAALIRHMDIDENVRGNLLKRKAKAVSHAKKRDKVVVAEQWDALIAHYDKFRVDLGQWEEFYKRGNQPQTFSLEGISEHVGTLNTFDKQTPQQWLSTLQGLQAKKAQGEKLTETDIITGTYLGHLYDTHIDKLLMGDKFEDAIAASEAYKGAAIEGDERPQQIHDAIGRIVANKDMGLDHWKDRIENLAKTEPASFTRSVSLELNYARKVLLGDIFDHAEKGNFETSIQQAENLISIDPAQAESLAQVVVSLRDSIAHPPTDTNYWLNKLAQAAAKLPPPVQDKEDTQTAVDDLSAGLEQLALEDEPTSVEDLTSGMEDLSLEPDSADDTPAAQMKDHMDRVISRQKLNTQVNDFVKRGFNGRAADLLEDMMNKDPSLKKCPELQMLKEDNYFQRDGERISIVLRGVQMLAADLVANMEEGHAKSTAKISLEIVNAAQIVCPNILTLMIQGGYESFNGNLALFQRNCEKELRPWLAVYEGFKEGLETSVTDAVTGAAEAGWNQVEFSYNSVMTGAQMGMLGLRATTLLDPWLSEYQTLRELRDGCIHYGNPVIQFAGASHAGYQLINIGLDNKLSPNWVSTIVKATFDAGCWALRYVQRNNGQEAETAASYLVQEGVSTTFGAASWTIVLTSIAGPFGFLAGTALFGTYTVHHNTSDSTVKNCARQALQGALGNIQYRASQESRDRMADAADRVSYGHIADELKNSFGNGNAQQGYRFDRSAGMSAIENVARVALWTNHYIKWYYDHEEFSQLQNWSHVVRQSQRVNLCSWFQIPAHFAWQGICYFILPAWVKHNLGGFHGHYQTLSTGMYQTGSSTWHQEYWETVASRLSDIHLFAMQKYIQDAQRATTPSAKRDLLNGVQLRFNYSSKTWNADLSDGHKFIAATLWYSLNEKEKCGRYLNSFDVRAYIHRTDTSSTAKNAVLMLEEVNHGLCQNILSDSHRADLGLDDDMVSRHIYFMLEKEQYDEARNFAERVPSYGKDTFYKNFGWHFSPNQMSPVKAVEYLLNEAQDKRGFNYWNIMFNFFVACINSCKYCPNQTLQDDNRAIFMGMLKLCADKMQTFSDLTDKQRENTIRAIHSANDFLKQYINLKKIINHHPILEGQALEDALESLYQEGYARLQGDTDTTSLLEQINQALHSSAAYKIHADGVIKRFMPIEVSPDGDCAFHTLGITRKKAAKLLKKVVNADIEPTAFGEGEALPTTEVQNSVFNLILDELEQINETYYDRSPEHKEANRRLILAHLENIKRPNYWLHSFQGQAGVYDAIALLLEKNLKIWFSDDHGQLSLFNNTAYHCEDFTEVNSLITNATGFVARNHANHYVLLQYHPSAIEEVLELEEVEQPQEDYLPSDYGFTPGFLHIKASRGSATRNKSYAKGKEEAEEEAPKVVAFTPNSLHMTESDVADKMLELEELFRLSMNPESELYTFLKTTPDHEITMKEMSTAISEILNRDGGTQKAPFIRALHELKPSSGFSMQWYLKFYNTELYLYLADNIERLIPVYQSFHQRPKVTDKTTPKKKSERDSAASRIRKLGQLRSQLRIKRETVHHAQKAEMEEARAKFRAQREAHAKSAGLLSSDTAIKPPRAELDRLSDQIKRFVVSGKADRVGHSNPSKTFFAQYQHIKPIARFAELRQFQAWYPQDIMEQLIHTAPRGNNILRVLFQGDFEKSLLEYKSLLNHLGRPGIFVSMEPGAGQNHYIFGIIHHNTLVVINPIGESKHRDFKEAIARLQKRSFDNIIISQTAIQHDPEGLVSCGPICAALSRHFSQMNIDSIIDLLTSGDLNIKHLLPKSLRDMVTSKDQTYQEIVVQLRNQHIQQLLQFCKETQGSPEHELHEARNSPEQVLLRRLVSHEINLLNLDEQPEYHALEKSDRLSAKY